MSTKLIDPYTSNKDITDDELISEYFAPKNYKKKNLYAIMAYRCNGNTLIKEILFNVIRSSIALNEIEMGIIKHAWLPALFILEYSDDAVKKELSKIIAEWPVEERELFINYIKREKKYVAFF